MAVNAHLRVLDVEVTDFSDRERARLELEPLGRGCRGRSCSPPDECHEHENEYAPHASSPGPQRDACDATTSFLWLQGPICGWEETRVCRRARRVGNGQRSPRT